MAGDISGERLHRFPAVGIVIGHGEGHGGERHQISHRVVMANDAVPRHRASFDRATIADLDPRLMNEALPMRRPLTSAIIQLVDDASWHY